MKNKLMILTAGLVLSLATSRVNAQNVAYVSRDSITKSIPGYAEKNKKVNDLIKTYQEEIKAKRDALNQRVAALLQPYNVKTDETQEQLLARMSPKDTTSVGLMRKEEAVIKSTEELYNAKVNELYAREVKPIEDKIRAAFKSYAVKNKLDIIYFIEDLSPALAYINTRKNVTASVLKEIGN